MIRKALKSLTACAWGGRLLAVALIFGLLAATAAPGEADSIAAYTGNSFLSGTGVDGTVNFAVFTSDKFATDAAGVLSYFAPGWSASPPAPGLDLSSGIYVYAFQVANNGSNTSSITSASFGKLSAADVTSWGYFTHGVVFKDQNGLVSSTNNLDVGATSVSFSVDSGISPALVWTNSTSVAVSFNIPNLATSSLLVYTSHYGPDWLSTQINGGAAGLVPGADPPPTGVPEPGTLILATIGMLGLGGLWRRRRSPAIRP